MNSNTITGFQGGTGRNQIITQTGNTIATATAFQVQTDSGTPVTAVLTVPQSTSITGASNPLDPNANAAITGNDYGRQYGRPNGTAAPWYSSTSFDFARPFVVRIVGTALANVSSTALAVAIYSGTSTSGTAIATYTSSTISAASNVSFVLETEVSWSVATGTLVGIHEAIACVGTTQGITTPTANTAAAVATASVLNFVAAATWTAASGTVSITEFSIAQV